MIQPRAFAAALEAEIQRLPAHFYDSFEYTKRGNNLTHPVTIGLISNVIADLAPEQIIAHDIRFNEAARKFQPDVILLDDDLDPLLYVDYESPNSSDARIPTKDVGAYALWVEDFHDALPYFIITTLPKRPTPDWELRHTGKDQYNSEFAGPGRHSAISAIRQNPFAFWYEFYRKHIPAPLPGPISFFNTNGKRVELITLV